jgi:hypothetical protein
MSEAASSPEPGRQSSLRIERLLEAVLVPVEPPAGLVDELEARLADVQAAAREALGELSEWELATMRDPRNWVRPAAAIAAGGVAAGGLVLVEMRRHRGKKPTRFSELAEQVSGIAEQVRDQVRNRRD